MEGEIQKIIEARIKKTKRMGHISPQNVETICFDDMSFYIISRMGFYGVSDIDGKYILPPVYDSIRPIPRSRNVIIEVSCKYGIYDLYCVKAKYEIQLTELKFYNDFTSIELCEGEKRGLWDIIGDRLVIPVKYDDVCVRLNYLFLWVKNESCYYFINKNTGERITPPPAKIAYESEYGMFVRLRQNDRVIALNVVGNEDDGLLRRTVVKHHGFLSLSNSKYEIHDIVNVYGNIVS